MRKDKLIAYDLGTGGIKASLFSADGVSLASIFRQYETFFPGDRLVEQRPMDWWAAVCYATNRLLQDSHTSPEEIACVALSGHSLVAVPIGPAGELLAEQVPIWCDMRADREAGDFFSRVSYEDWYTVTGNGDPPETYTLFKLMWMKRHQPRLYQTIDTILGSKDFINYKLTGVKCTDPSYASGFGVFHLREWRYEKRFMEAAGIRPEIFPPIVPSDQVIGTVTAEAAAACGLLPGTPVAAGAVDNTCMSVGARGLEEGVVYASLGSSSWIAVTSREPVINLQTRPFVFANAVRGTYTSAVSIFSAGNSYRWMRDTFMKDMDSQSDVYEKMNEMAASVPPGSHGVLFNPSLAGGSAQEPSPHLSGAFLGLKLSTTREDLIRACMEGVALSLRNALDILRSQTPLRGDMLLCGGCSKSAVWREIFANVFHMPVLKTNIDQDAASLGAAALAANAVGLWDGYGRIPKIHIPEDRIEPDPELAGYYERLLPLYQEWTGYLAKLGDDMSRLPAAPLR